MAGRFETTRWSMVLAARDATGTSRREALAALCEAYWPPVYAFVRRNGHGPDEAQDLTQGYFTLLLEKDYLGDVNPELGRFRSFLLASVGHYLSNDRDRARAAKRGSGKPAISFDGLTSEQRLALEPRTDLTPEGSFEIQWALTLLARTMDRLSAEAEAQGKHAQLEQLKTFLTDAGAGPRYRDVAAALGVGESAVKVAVHRLRRRFGDLLREEIKETVNDGAEVDAEIRHLFAVLGSSGSRVS